MHGAAESTSASAGSDKRTVTKTLATGDAGFSRCGAFAASTAPPFGDTAAPRGSPWGARHTTDEEGIVDAEDASGAWTCDPRTGEVGIHSGPCIAVNQNGVLDYFGSGSTVNLAARLVAFSSGEDIVVSGAVLADSDVAALSFSAAPIEGALNGFEDEVVATWRVRA
jgi:hypothetical protein